MKILIVDDSATVRAGMRKLVEKMGHSAIEAEDGDKALSTYLRDRPDLVLIDVEMPVMDGYEAARRMRESSPDDWVPIIFLSSKEDDQDLDRAIEAGGDDYLIKPVSYVVLNAKIRALHRLETMRSKLSEMSRDLASANRELEKLSRQDGLTGIANRRYFDSYLLNEVRRSARERGPLSLIISDIDEFKAFNDCYGHQAGDDCLRQVAMALSSVGRRPADLAARYGGEEFAMILPGTVVEGAVDVAQSVSRVIAGLAIPHARSATGRLITLSQGIVAVVPEQETTPEDLILRADKALYQAKEQGRNRCVVFGENKSRGPAAASSS
jgi:diguanylate cyclase (GGDEF)-like protein